AHQPSLTDNAVPDQFSDVEIKTKSIIDKYARYTVNTYERPPIIFTHGKGCYLYDLAGREYLDFTAGIAVNALGHGDPNISKILYEQSQKLIHLSNLYYGEAAANLAETLVTSTTHTPFRASKVFFANSGTESNEAAIKFARKHAK